MFGREFVGDFAGAVGGIVVDDEEVHRDGQGQKALDERGKVFPLVVGRHNDKCLIHAPEAAIQYLREAAKTSESVGNAFATLRRGKPCFVRVPFRAQKSEHPMKVSLSPVSTFSLQLFFEVARLVLRWL